MVCALVPYWVGEFEPFEHDDEHDDGRDRCAEYDVGATKDTRADETFLG